MSLSIEFYGHELVLLSERAIFWPSQSALLVADLHLGKDSNFRASGIPIPPGPDSDTLTRLDALLAKTKPTRLMILGDLFHGKFSDTGVFNRWVDDQSGLQVELIVGNHDRWISTADLKVNCCSSVEIEGILLSHAPLESEQPMICGHIHPGYLLEGAGRTERLQCFWQQRSCLVMPAFGSFTGNYWITPEPGDRVFVIAGRQVFLVPV